ncbi:MAG TPA: hypothetical protein VF025_01540, partial [Gaiellaceae bacterium]
RSDHSQHQEEGGGQEDRLEGQHAVGRVIDPRFLPNGPDSFLLKMEPSGREAHGSAIVDSGALDG